jgi:hypothetical protein
LRKVKRRNAFYQRAVARTLHSRRFQSWKVVLAHVQYREEPSGRRSPFDETHYTPAQLAKLWGVSDDTIREIFKHEPGVLAIGKPGTRTKRGYVSLRIPQSVAVAVHTRLSARPANIRVRNPFQ